MIPSKKSFFEKFKAEVLQDIREKAAQIVQSILELMRKNIRRWKTQSVPLHGNVNDPPGSGMQSFSEDLEEFVYQRKVYYFS